MSLSNADNRALSGRVFTGSTGEGPRVTTIQSLEGKKKPVWDEDANRELIERVKQKAREQAREILAQAMQEAEAVKKQAYEEGLAQAQQEAQALLDQHAQQLSDTLAQTLSGIQDQAREVWQAQRQDFVALIRMAVEKTLAVELSEQREESLANLLEQALELVESRRMLTLKVAPADAETIQGLLAAAAERHPDLKNWRVKADESIAPGGVRLESADGMVDNTVAGRFEEVEAVFDHLVVPD